VNNVTAPGQEFNAQPLDRTYDALLKALQCHIFAALNFNLKNIFLSNFITYSFRIFLNFPYNKISVENYVEKIKFVLYKFLLFRNKILL